MQANAEKQKKLSEAEPVKHGDDETDAVIKRRQKESLNRFQTAQSSIYDNIKLIRGLRCPTTDQEKDLVEKCRGLQDEREATFSGELQSSFFLFRGSEVCKFVGKIRLNNRMHGTGFMVSERLLMTCHHVFEQGKKHCKEGFVKFGTIDPFAGFPRPLKEAEFRLEPETFYYYSEKLDMALIAVAKQAVNPPRYSLSNIGFCSEVNDAEVLPGQHVNIIQFPGADEPQQMILRQNQVVQVDEKYVKFVEVEFIQSHDHVTKGDDTDGADGTDSYEYEVFQHMGDTLPGSSGAACFDDEWRLIGMHHSALHVTHSNWDAKSKKYVANEGTSVAAIATHIQENITEAASPPEGYDPRILGRPFERSSSNNCSCSIF